MLSLNFGSRRDVKSTSRSVSFKLRWKKPVLLEQNMCRSQRHSGCFEEEDISCGCCFTYREGTRGARCNGLAYKRNFYAVRAHESPKLGKRYSSTLSLTSAVYVGGLSTPRLGRFTSGDDPIPIVQEAGWGGLDRRGNSRPHWISIPRLADPH